MHASRVHYTRPAAQRSEGTVRQVREGDGQEQGHAGRVQGSRRQRGQSRVSEELGPREGQGVYLLIPNELITYD